MQYFNRRQKISLARSLFSKASPAYIQFYVTSRCNMACEQCNIIYPDAAMPEMDIDQIRRMAANLAEIGVCIVLLIGGEPFVRQDLPDIVKAFTDVDIHVRLQTNGLASREALEACVQNGAHDISISLDSLQPRMQDTINGNFSRSWDRAIETVAIINDIFPANGTAFFGTVLMPRNYKQIPGIIEFATQIGWGVSLVPVHTTTPAEPRGFRAFGSDAPLWFEPSQLAGVREVLKFVSGMRRRGFNLYDSDQYLDDVGRFVSGQPIRWRRRNKNVCDSPSLYFAVAPNGALKPCCDYGLDSFYPVYDSDFPAWFRDGRIHRQVQKLTKSCAGCMYGSYPEITVNARFFKPMLHRALYFNLSPARLKKMSARQMKELAGQIGRKWSLAPKESRDGAMP